MNSFHGLTRNIAAILKKGKKGRVSRDESKKGFFSLMVFHACVYCRAVTSIVKTGLIVQGNAFSFNKVIHKYLTL